MERLTKEYDDNSGYTVIQEYGGYYPDFQADAYFDCVNKLGKYEDLEERIGLSFKTLIDICDNKQNIVVEPKQMTMTIWKEKWENVKVFIPISFNSTTIYCDVWYEENFKGHTERLPLYIKEINNSWWLKENEEE